MTNLENLYHLGVQISIFHLRSMPLLKWMDATGPANGRMRSKPTFLKCSTCESFVMRTRMHILSSTLESPRRGNDFQRLVGHFFSMVFLVDYSDISLFVLRGFHDESTWSFRRLIFWKRDLQFKRVPPIPFGSMTSWNQSLCFLTQLWWGLFTAGLGEICR